MHAFFRFFYSGLNECINAQIHRFIGKTKEIQRKRRKQKWFEFQDFNQDLMKIDK